MDTPIALITGGTSGIGLAAAQRLAAEGFGVYLAARDAAAVAAVCDKLTAEGALSAGSACDVTSTQSVDTAVSDCVDRLGRVDVLVNSAGRGGGGTTASIPDDLWIDVVDTNLHGTFRMMRAVLSHGGMLERGWGRIINVASTGGKQGVMLAAPYSASKHGVVGLSKAVGLELAKTGVTVNAVCPGYVETPMAERVRASYAEHWGITPAQVQERFEAKIPLGRYTTPQEVAALISYLASDQAAAVTAQAMNVCGGLGNY